MHKILSIVTVVYNASALLGKTLLNVQKAKALHEGIEYIVIDGQSTDDTLQIIKANEFVIDKWISEKDTGIYNAMNKAISHVNGKWVLFLNAGDTLLESEIEHVLTFLREEEYACICYGGFNQVFEKHTITKPAQIVTNKDMFVLKNPVCHQSTFYRCEYFLTQSKNLFDESYKLISDQVTLYTTSRTSITSLKAFNVIVCNYDTDGISAKFRDAVQKERIMFCTKLIKDEELENRAYWQFSIAILVIKSFSYSIVAKLNMIKFYRSLKKHFYN